MGNKLGKKDLGKKEANALPKGLQRTKQVLHDTDRELRIVKRIQEIFLTIPDDKTYAKVLDVILEAMDSRHGLFGYINPDDESCVCSPMVRGGWDKCRASKKNIVFPREIWDGMWGRSLKEKKTLYSNKPFRVPQGHFPIRRSMSLPILYHNQLIGHIHVANKETDYDEKDRVLLETIAGHIAPVLHARQQREKQEEERKQAEKLIRIQRDLGIALSGARNLEKALALVIDTATTLEGMDCGGIYLVDPDTGAIDLQFAKGLSPDFIKQVSHYDKDSDNTRLVMEKKPVFVEYSKLKIKKQKIEHLESLKATAVIPILHHGHVIACMNIASHTHKGISVSAQNALVAIASQAGSALARLQMEEKLAQYRHSLEKQVKERAMGLRKANEQLRKEVSRRKEVNKALSESEERYRLLVENIKLGISLIDAGYSIVMVNTATGAMFNKNASELIGKKCYREFEKRKKVCAYCPGTRAMTTGLPQEVETEGVLDDGSRFKARVQAFPTFGADGKASGFIEVVEDISETKKAEEQISKLSHAVEQSPTAIVVTDITGNIEYVNPQFTRLTGYSSEEVLGKNPRFLKSGEQPTEFYQQLWDTINSGEVWHGEFHNKKKNGEFYWESASISPIMDGEGAITHFVAIKEDITNRKKTEKELRKAREELEQRVKERTDELKQTFDQLLHAEKLSAIGKLTASIAHEFNNPLFGIRSVLEGIKMRGSFDKEDSELLELGIRECNRIKDLIISLQKFNRPTSGEMKPMNIQQAIEDMLLLCKKEFKTRKITVEEFYTTDLPEIQAVEDQIKQVILNLLKNAEEAIPEEGGIIKIATKRFKKKVAIQIHDSGVGIKAEDKNKIFDPFYSTKSSVKGAGLGLSVSYGIVKRHGGVVDVESKPNKGTTFTVTLPVKGRI